MLINRRMLFTIALTISAFGITAQANSNLAPLNLSTSDTTSSFCELNRVPSLTNDNLSSLTGFKSQGAVFSVKYNGPDIAFSLASGGDVRVNSVMPGVPEPSTMLLLGTGLVGALRYRARRKKSAAGE